MTIEKSNTEINYLLYKYQDIMATPTTQPVPQRETADPLPYVIVFALLVFIWLAIVTWTLDVWFKANQCASLPGIWCSDTWTCNNSCPTGPNTNPCFTAFGTAANGLASCIWGPNAPGATVCLFAPTGGTAGTTAADEVSCTCTTGMQLAPNCFSACAQNLSSIDTSISQCCCCPGMVGCPWGQDNVPRNCRFTPGQPCFTST